MYEDAAILAAVVLLYSAAAGRVGRSWLSGPILFTAAGFVRSGGAGRVAAAVDGRRSAAAGRAGARDGAVHRRGARGPDGRAAHGRVAGAAAADRPAADDRARLPDRAG